MAVAVTASALIALAFWLTRATHLSGQINIVGYPTFANYNYLPHFLAYRLATYAFPVGVIVIYLVLDWRGPLKGRKLGPRVQPVPLRDPPAPAFSPARSGPWATLAPWLRLIPPAVVVALAVRPRTALRLAEVTRLRIAAAFIYVLAVTVISGLAFLATDRYLSRRARPFAEWLSIVNAAGGAVAAFGGLWLVSHDTVIVSAERSIHVWPWLPWWLATIGIAIAWVWLGRQLRLGRAPRVIEQRLRTVLLGSAAMYLIVAEIPGAISFFQGFDDSQDLTGATLLQHGYFPWRDFQFIHGFFLDILQSLVGFHLFTPSAWGSIAGTYLVLVPLTWVGIYLLGVWATRRGSLTVLAALALAAWGGLTLDPRLIALSPALILLGKAIESPRLRWTTTLTALLFAESILIPEADYQVVAVFVVLLGVDFVHRRPGERLAVTFRRTLCFIATGAVLTVAWVVFLAAEHALTAFIDWYVVFVPGHDAEGDIPATVVSTSEWVMFGLMMVLAVATFLTAAWRARYRKAWTSRAWVTLAAALNAAVYGEQAIARFDGGHVQLSLDVALPMFLLIIGAVVPAIEDWLVVQTDRVWGLRERLAWRPQPVALLGLIAVVGFLPTVRSDIWHAPRRTRQVIGADQAGGPLGYALPGAIAPGTLADLRKVLDTYARKNAPFFDMTNSPGYFYYLLGRRPATVFTNISLAIPEGAQRMLVDDLRRSRPPLVAFNSSFFGMPAWDGVQNQVRHFLVSQYVLDHWTPILSTHGVLFLLRNDLLASRPAVPHLTQPPITKDLYNSQGSCTWGDAPNFLGSPAVGPSMTIRAQGALQRRDVTVTGWAFDSAARAAAKKIVVTVGSRAVATAPLTVSRPDVAAALHTRAATRTGFAATATTTASGPIRVYSLTRDGALHLLPGTANQAGTASRSIRMPDGSVRRVGAPGTGSLDTLQTARVTDFPVPASVSPRSYQLVTLGAARAIGTAQVTLSDTNGLTAGGPGDVGITAGALPVGGSRLAIRVGSCLPWHGYAGHTLYLTQQGGAPITSLTLSNVQQ